MKSNRLRGGAASFHSCWIEAFSFFNGGIQMTLRVNGKQVSIDGLASISDLLAHYQLQQKIVVVEQNGEIVDRSRYETTPIADGDRIEIVHFVGGG
jgi:sulfur carrier protein